ncbi:transcriptional regulator, TetR family [Pseudooceanicola antarcticus]|uniref:TetR/AcrR family transcriptional regulator n=1 Tax=Pseudooceanicola antarcticus TaxID=1247613 RepID=A0A285JEA6_9RHOB|nr:TetR/AcrR family transcriptional regulator [Pseudooceanicola antarcticus]PJE30901.1 TetR/AcrR family transcriptional regulator [Pseudooceanicola antarcticus]SNY57736.1 transcriptional regulator, TetR family [Pseudooceanicola antarcticus]
MDDESQIPPGDTALRLRKTALELFARHGYAAVSMRQIAGEVGVQVGALYNHISDKQALLYRLMAEHMVELLQAVAAADLPKEPLAALEGFTRFHIRHHAARPEAVFISYMELRNLSPENFALLEEQRQAYEARLRQILERGQAEGVMQIADARIATRAVIAMLTGITTWFRDGGGQSLAEVEEIYWEMVRRLVTR